MFEHIPAGVSVQAQDKAPEANQNSQLNETRNTCRLV
jgi:hypothetical protein